jgi:histone-lysine N-methyltransferase SETMAR
MNVLTEWQSKQWMHTHLLNKPKNFKQTLPARKLMAAVFWDRKGVLMMEFMQQGVTIMSEVYCETLKKLRRAIQNKRRRMLTSGVVLHHDSARPHIAACTRVLLDDFNWELLDQPSYRPDLAPSDYHLKNWWELQRFKNNEELMDGSSSTEDIFVTGTQKLIPLL